MIPREIAAAALLAAIVAAAPGQAATASITTVGWIEDVMLGDEGVRVAAKLDTGALTSSLHATDVRWTTKTDGDWVSFDVVGVDGARVRFERKVVRISRIKPASGGSEKRPVVLMGVCLGRVHRVTEVNLTDRSGFNYEFLVGRRFLSAHFAVDSARTRTIEPACAQDGKR